LMNAKEIGSFLREGIIPIAVERDVCIHCVHHVAKPSRDNDAKAHWSDLDFQYLGFGSSEIQNAFRVVNILLPHSRDENANGSPDEQIFRLIFSKRGTRAGALDTHGHAATNIYLAQSREGLCWLQVDKPDEARERGRPQLFNVDTLLANMGDLPIRAAHFCRRVRDETGMSRATFFRLFDEAKKAHQITCKNDLYSKANPF